MRRKLTSLCLALVLGLVSTTHADVTFVAAGTAVSGTGSITVAWPTHVADDVALLFIESCGGEAATLSTPAGFVNVTGSPQSTGSGTSGTRLTVYWCRATSSSMASPVVTDPGDHVYGIILTFRGVVATGDPWDVTDGGTKATASTTTTFGTVTTNDNNDLIVLAASRDNDSTAAAWSAWTNANLSSLTEQSDGGTTSGNGGGVGVATGGKLTAGAIGSTTATVTSSVDGHMTIALKPVAGVNLPGQATNPNPADSSMYDGTDVTLTWTPGRDADKHDVYFDDNFNDVNNATRASHPGLLHYAPNHLNANYPVTGLTAGATYYWRIDEVNAPPYASTIYKGTVWSFTTKSLTASNPSPPDKDVLVDPNTNLSWSAGLYAADVNGHKVYFDPCEAKVTARAGCQVNGVSRTEPNYIIGPLLDVNDTYYWAIDEVNGPNTWPGPVWSFTTWPDIPITDPNLVGWWKFEDSGGNKTLDSSGHNRHGTLNGSPAYATGIFDQAINLDGTNDFVSVGSVGISGAAPRTIAGWAKMNDTNVPGWTNVFGFTGGGNYNHFNIVVSGGNAPPVPAGWYVIHIYWWQQPIIGPDLEWHHFAATYDGTTIRWYGDGSLIGEAAYDINTVDNVQMGKSADNDNYFPGIIDDVRIYNKALTEAEIGQIMASTSAYKPYPADEAIGVPWQLTLTWEPGLDANSVKGHRVYFDPNEQKVINRSGCVVNGVIRTNPSYTLPTPPAPLALDQTYYWRVDEVNNAGSDPCFWEGKVWSFTVVNYIVVDDFDSYADDDALRAVWTAAAYTGAAISLQTGNADANLVHDGNSMNYHYDSYYWWLSEAYADTADLPRVGSNWTAGGVKALVLWFYGKAGNDANEQMYVKLTDGASNSATMNYPPSKMNDIREERWQEWNIPLAAFTGVNLADVNRITIGFGDGIAGPGEGLGTVYFEDIRLKTVQPGINESVTINGQAETNIGVPLTPDEIKLIEDAKAKLKQEGASANLKAVAKNINEILKGGRLYKETGGWKKKAWGMCHSDGKAGTGGDKIKIDEGLLDGKDGEADDYQLAVTLAHEGEHAKQTGGDSDQLERGAYKKGLEAINFLLGKVDELIQKVTEVEFLKQLVKARKALEGRKAANEKALRGSTRD